MAKKVLVVDDDELVLIAIRELLTPSGYAVTTCSSGADALAEISREHFDLVILDVIMPEMDGLEVCRRIRNTKSYAEIPVIILTAKSGDEDKKKGVEVGANLYLPKPISPKRLIALVEEAIK
jgi:two-component system, OmpR family, alkaline phosphatase synthesis response regulator PhoP